MSELSPIFRAKVEKGKINFYKPDLFSLYIGTLENKEVEVVVRKWKKTRSNKQNRWYWGVAIKLIADYTGESPEKIHEYLKSELGFKELVNFKNKNGEIILEPIPISTAKLLTTEFNEYKNAIQVWASENLGIYIPDPNEVI